MTPTPILKVLSSMQKNGVRCLLMGGQVCVLYGAAEFSRDIYLVVLLDGENLKKLQSALSDLNAEVIAVPEFSTEYLERGHAVHFRSQHPDATGLRIDVMSRLRGVAKFEVLWSRRTTTEVEGVEIDLLSLPDLVLAKKTQRDKDWPMLSRLVEANYFTNQKNPNIEQIKFWLREMRTAELLAEIVAKYPEHAEQESSQRSLLKVAQHGNSKELTEQLFHEEARERQLDLEYWKPLRQELAECRRLRRR